MSYLDEMAQLVDVLPVRVLQLLLQADKEVGLLHVVAVVAHRPVQILVLLLPPLLLLLLLVMVVVLRLEGGPPRHAGLPGARPARHGRRALAAAHQRRPRAGGKLEEAVGRPLMALLLLLLLLVLGLGRGRVWGAPAAPDPPEAALPPRSLGRAEARGGDAAGLQAVDPGPPPRPAARTRGGPPAEGGLFRGRVRLAVGVRLELAVGGQEL